MTIFINLLKGEYLKSRRTIVIWMPVLIISLVVIYELLTYQTPNPRIFRNFNHLNIFISNILMSWMAPLYLVFSILSISILNNFEISGNSMSHLFSLPPERWKFYFTKILFAHILALFYLIVFLLLVLLAVFVFLAIQSDINLTGPVYWKIFISGPIKLYFSSWLLISLHTWLSQRYKSFSKVIAIGFFGLFCAMVLHNDNWGNYWPWLLYPEGSELNPAIGYPFRIAGGVIVGIIGCIDATRRDVF